MIYLILVAALLSQCLPLELLLNRRYRIVPLREYGLTKKSGVGIIRFNLQGAEFNLENYMSSTQTSSKPILQWGRPVAGREKSVRHSFIFPVSMKSQLEARALETGVPAAEYVRRLILNDMQRLQVIAQGKNHD